LSDQPKKRTKRGNGEGCVRQRKDGYWTAIITIGYDDNGKPKRKTFYGKTRKEVVAKMDEAKSQLMQGTFTEASKITLGEWMVKWLEEYKKPTIRQNTFESYYDVIKTHILPCGISRVKLQKIQACDLQSFYNDKLKNGRIDNKGGLSTRYVRYIHTLIREALEQALKENLVSRNMADATSPPTVKTKGMQILTKEQLQDFISVVREDRLATAFILDIGTGLRRGELLGLKWDCVDFKKSTIIIKRQLLSLKDGPVIEEDMKTKSSKRSIPLAENLIKELKAHKVRQAKEKLQIGDMYNDQGLVFCQEDGSPIEPKSFTKRFQNLLKQAGLPKLRLHDLRHTHASLLLSENIHPKVVQERLGHSSISMTLDLYSHLSPGLQEAASQKIDNLFETEKEPSVVERFN
jgi:integrase